MTKLASLLSSLSLSLLGKPETTHKCRMVDICMLSRVDFAVLFKVRDNVFNVLLGRFQLWRALNKNVWFCKTFYNSWCDEVGRWKTDNNFQLSRKNIDGIFVRKLFNDINVFWRGTNKLTRHLTVNWLPAMYKLYYLTFCHTWFLTKWSSWNNHFIYNRKFIRKLIGVGKLFASVDCLCS